MNELSREQKLAAARRLNENSDWGWLKSELEKVVVMRKMNPNSVIDQNTLFRMGVVAGLEYAISYPGEAEKNLQKWYDSIMQKMMGAIQKTEEDKQEVLT